MNNFFFHECSVINRQREIFVFLMAAALAALAVYYPLTVNGQISLIPVLQITFRLKYFFMFFQKLV